MPEFTKQELDELRTFPEGRRILAHIKLEWRKNKKVAKIMDELSSNVIATMEQFKSERVERSMKCQSAH